MQNKIIYSVFCFSIIYNFICTQCLQGKATHIKSTSTSSRDQTILWLWSLFLSVWIFLLFTFTNSFNFTFAILHQLAVRMTSVVLLSYWSQISVRGLSLVLSLFGLRTKEKSLLCYSPTPCRTVQTLSLSLGLHVQSCFKAFLSDSRKHVLHWQSAHSLRDFVKFRVFLLCGSARTVLYVFWFNPSLESAWEKTNRVWVLSSSFFMLS